MKCNDRTGAHSFGFLTRASVDDSGKPSWFGSASGVDFLKEVLHLDPWDVLTLFEQWACAMDKGKFSLNITYHYLLTIELVPKRLDSSTVMRRDCAKSILNGLSEFDHIITSYLC